MEIKCFVTGDFSVNSYLLTDGDKCAIIDPGGSTVRILDEVKKRGTLEKIILTHGHFDHYGAAEDIKKQTGAKLYIHKNDEKMLSDDSINLSELTTHPPKHTDCDGYLVEGETINVGNVPLEIYLTPGHSEGSVSLYCREEKALFSGDLLFNGSIGRFDYGDLRAELKSLKFLMKNFDEDVTVYPGHGPKTTIGEEKYNNPYIVNHVELD